MRTANNSLIDASIDMSTSFELVALYVATSLNYAIQLVFSGSPTGKFKLQCSNDEGRFNAADLTDVGNTVINWTDIEDSAQEISEAGNHTYNVHSVGYRWARVVYLADVGSTGSLDSARFNVKGV